MLSLFHDVSPLTWLSMSRADTGILALCWGGWRWLGPWITPHSNLEAYEYHREEIQCILKDRAFRYASCVFLLTFGRIEILEVVRREIISIVEKIKRCLTMETRTGHKCYGVSLAYFVAKKVPETFIRTAYFHLTWVASVLV